MNHAAMLSCGQNRSDFRRGKNNRQASVRYDFFSDGGKVREDGRMVHDMHLMRIKKPEESKQKWDLYEYVATVAGDDGFRPMVEGGCLYLAK